MDENMIFERIRALAAENFSLSENEITLDASYTDLGLDSLDAYELLMAIEESFEIELPEDDLDNITTMQAMVDLVADNL